ncbi:MAG TPA: hypothetical protein VJK29_19685, partial [Terriglobales bacterium]|nr:hypothetical protein [Terriglobales bacterium]
MIELKHRQDADDLAAKLNKLIDSLTVKALASNLLLAYKEYGNGQILPRLHRGVHSVETFPQQNDLFTGGDEGSAIQDWASREFDETNP